MPTNPPTIGSEILQTADATINGPRRAEYGPPKASFERIATLWSATLGHTVTPAQVALCLVQLKVARLVQTNDHADSWVDLAGYAACGAEITEARP